MKHSLKYNSVAVFCGGQVGTNDESNFRFMGGCQSTQLTFTSSIVKEKELGSKKTFYRSEYLKESVAIPLTWYPSDFENEERAGLNLISYSGKSIAHKLFEGFRTNLMVLVDDESQQDLLQRSVSGVKAVFLPNADLVSYGFTAAVGSVMEANGTFECDDAWITTLSGFTGSYNGVSNGFRTKKPFSIAETGFISNNFEQVFIPSGMSVEIKDRHDGNTYDLSIQSFSVDIELVRNNIRGLGSKYDAARVLKAPVFGSLQIESLSPAFSGRNYNNVPLQEQGFDVKLSLKGTPIKNLEAMDFEFEFRNVILNTDSTSFGIGANATNTLSFDIEDDGSDY